jgi:hypothetical protein
MKFMIAAAVSATIVAVTLPPAAQAQPASPPATDLYHVHFTKAAPGQAVALAKVLTTPDKTSPMPEHFIVFRHQEGDDWDYAVIQHLGPKTELSASRPVPPEAERNLRAWHNDTFAVGPSWGEFTKQLGIGGTGAAQNAVYIVGVQRTLPGHTAQLEQALNAAGPGKVQTGTVLLRHAEGGDWTFLTITRYNSWQDLATDRAAAQSAAPSAGGWAGIREHSAFHRDTIADRVYPNK